jgi:hypothetical protein
MPLKNYTTTIKASKTIGEIQEILAQRGARQIMIDYQDGRANRVCFTIDTPIGLQAVVLPVQPDRVLAVLRRDGVKADYTRAENVAWRIAKDWLVDQLAILDTEMVTIDQVLLPYFVDRSGRSVYELYNSGQLMIAGGDR